MNFYLYLWLREDGTPYYVGKGRGTRASDDHGWAKAPKDQSRIRIYPMPDEATALAFECYVIDFWGRKDKGTGVLRNLTDGGENPPKNFVGRQGGWKLSQETRSKLSRRLKGVKKSFRTKEHCQKLSEANKGKPSYLRTEEILQKQSTAQFGRPRSDLVGHRNYCTTAGIEKMRKSKTGSKASPETRLRMSSSAVLGWAKRRGTLQLSL